MTAEARSKLRRLHVTAEELAAYLRRNAGQIINYGDRHRAGERISTGFVESVVNQVVSKRFSKKQSVRWTQAGAHLALQARTRVLNGELEDTFRRRWPGFQPPSKAEPDEAGNGSFALPPQPATAAPVAPVCDGLVPLPPYAPELNPVERVWLYLRERFLSHRLLDDYDAIVDACCAAWNRLTPERLRSLCSYPYIQQVNC